ncbi:MAG: MATE family efflux transporter [Ruthenibacterium sp.]|jgi:Na+-driven multidrug efflux pump
MLCAKAEAMRAVQTPPLRMHFTWLRCARRPGRLAALLGASGEVTAMAHTYLRVMLLFSPAFIFNAVLVCFVRNDGQPRLAMLSMVIGSFSNIVLDYIFIFLCGMGIFGDVLAAGLALVLGIALLLPHWFSAHRGFHARLARTRARRAPLHGWGCPRCWHSSRPVW